MPEKTRELRKNIAEELLRRVRACWERYRNALKRSDMKGMREEYEALIRLLRPVYRRAFRKELEDFLRKENMPVQAIFKRITK